MLHFIHYLYIYIYIYSIKSYDKFYSIFFSIEHLFGYFITVISLNSLSVRGKIIIRKLFYKIK